MKFSLHREPKPEKAEKLSIDAPIHPHRDWSILLSVFAGLVLCIACWSAYVFFLEASSDTSSEVMPSSGKKTKTVEAVHDFFKARQSQHASSTDRYFADPSI